MDPDTRLQQEVLDELGREPGLEDAGIGVDVDAGVVTLQGLVGSLQLRWNAEGAALRVAGMVALVINIRVRLVPRPQRTDADIARAARRLLQWLARLDPEDVSVRVDQGWVTLRGQLDWNYQRQAAAEAVQDLLGVAGVHNHIVLRPRVPVAALRGDIEAALGREAAVAARRLRVGVDGGDVTLGGSVDSRREHERALAAVRNLPGVRRVLDSITVHRGRVPPAAGRIYRRTLSCRRGSVLPPNRSAGLIGCQD